MRWEEQLLQLKEEIFKSKMQKTPRKLCKTTSLLGLESLSPQCKNPELQKMPSPQSGDFQSPFVLDNIAET